MITKMGNTFPRDEANLQYANAVAYALRLELGPTHRAIKTLRQWTNANERTAKHWLAGTHGPSGYHLVMLAQHSDKVLQTFLCLAHRRATLATSTLPSLRDKLMETLALLNDSLQTEDLTPSEAATTAVIKKPSDGP